MEEFDEFLIKMQTLDDPITDFTQPMSDRCVQEFEKKFHHTPVKEVLHESIK